MSTAQTPLTKPQAAPSSLPIPRHILTGYWHNWQTEKVKFIRLKDVCENFDIVHVAFATAIGALDGRMSFVPYPGAIEEQFKSDVRDLQQRGKKVVISVGGATGSVAIADSQARQNFVDSMTSIIHQYSFDGIDINLEGKVRLDTGDSDYRSPTSPSILFLIDAIRAIQAVFGNEFIVSLAPETMAVQGGYRKYADGWGAYLPILHSLRDMITYVQVQHYNSAAMTGMDGRRYFQGTPDFHVAMAEMLLKGFPINGDKALFFSPLRPDQIVIGLTASDKILNDGYTSPQDIHKALDYLSRGQGFGGSYVLRKGSGYPGLRGVMTWSINWDAITNFCFSTATRSVLNALP